MGFGGCSGQTQGRRELKVGAAGQAVPEKTCWHMRNTWRDVGTSSGAERVLGAGLALVTRTRAAQFS